MTAPGASPSRRTLTAARILGVLVPLLLWWIAAAVTGISVALPYPHEVILVTLAELTTPGFLQQVAATVVRGLAAILFATAIGVPLGLVAGRSVFVYALTRPLLLTVRAIPFISVILVAVIWFSSGTVPVFVAVLMALPIVADAARTAVSAVDSRLEEMTRVHGLGVVARIVHLWVPGSLHGTLGGIRSATGIAWKVTVAAEVLSSPAVGIGAQMGEARLYLETERVLAWTIVLIAVAGLSDWVVRVLQQRSVTYRRRPASAHGDLAHGDGTAIHGSGTSTGGGPTSKDSTIVGVNSLSLERVTFAWDRTPLMQEFSIAFERERVTALVGPSGIGKTTLLTVCAGAIAPQSGGVEVAPFRNGAVRVGMVFQEPRLLPWRTVEDNVMIAGEGESSDRLRARETLSRVGLAGIGGAYPHELSGGMQQRVALARAIHRTPQILLIDEPLSGVDPQHRADLTKELKTVIDRHQALTVVASHDLAFVLAIADRVVVLSGPPIAVASDLHRPTEGWSPATESEIVNLVAQVRQEKV
jgi:NitT/TauT family transport system permease protein